MFAHSIPGTTVGWEPVLDHSEAVGLRCAVFASSFGWTEVGRLMGCLHDIGKCSPAFQAYIEAATGEVGSRGPDHATAGAREAVAILGQPVGRLVAFALAGHHSGLADGEDLADRLAKAIEPYESWRAHVGPLPTRAALAETRPPREGAEGRGFTYAFLARMLFSCLVDADRLETAGFYARAEGRSADCVEGTPLPILRDRLRAHMATLSDRAGARAGTATAAGLNAARAEILAHALGKVALSPGLFTLTVPTGGGKTLASLAFALAHAAEHDLRRIVYVIPFSSIIEQTAAVFRGALGPAPGVPNDGDVLEHHASFDWETALRADRAAEDGRGSAPVERLQRATENWDAPVVVTTAVQFFESLFSNRPSACRKLHNLAGSVIVLDEVQTLPLRILRPCLAALDELARNYGASIVLCTATQPAWRQIDGKLLERPGGRPGRNLGLDIPVERELAPDPAGLFERLRRVEVDYRPEPIADDVVAARFAEQPQMLCIVNSRRHAKAMFDRIQDLPGAIHLSTWMCPRHRRLVLERARADLKAGAPVRIVSTSLIEAGVDIDLPEVWRAAAGIDSCLQAAGRCNREFTLAAGRLVVFLQVEDRAPHDLGQAWDAGREVLRHHPDPQTLAAIAAYFGRLYANLGSDLLDGSTLGTGQDKRPYPILRHIRERADDLAFPFASIAEAFRVIEDTMAPVIVPWSSGPDDTEAADLLRRIRAMNAPQRGDLRRLQHYTVSIPETQRGAWFDQGVLRAVHPSLGDAMLCFDDLALYDERSGLRVSEPERRSADSNVM